MQTFETQLPRRGFWAALLLPPAIYWTGVAVLDYSSQTGGVPTGPFLSLLALAHGLPLGALAWIWFSVAACSVTPTRLILHAVSRDREWDLAQLRRIQVRRSGVVLLELDAVQLQFRPKAIEPFLAAILDARQDLPLPVERNDSTAR